MFNNKESFISTTSGMSGYFAVMMWWNPDGFWEPYDTGVGRYNCLQDAESEAKEWAECEGLKYFEVGEIKYI